MTTPPPRTQRPQTEHRRAAILRAAAEVFGAKGSNNGTLADIAQRVGMTHAGVLHYFGSKANLLLAVLVAHDRNELDGRPLPDGEALFTHLAESARMNGDRRAVMQAFAVLSAESVTHAHPARDYFENRYAQLRRLIEDALTDVRIERRRGEHPDRRAQSASGLSGLTVERGAAAIIAVMDGLQVQWLLDPTAFDLGETTGAAITALVDAVAGTADEPDPLRPAATCPR